MGEALVTGANGFVGSHLCEALMGAGYGVRAMIRETSDLTNLEGVGVSFVYADLDRPESLPAAVEGVEVVVNNAGVTKALDLSRFEEVNVVGTRNILDAVKRLTHRFILEY